MPAREPAFLPVESLCPARRSGELTDEQAGYRRAASGRLMTQPAVLGSEQTAKPRRCLTSRSQASPAPPSSPSPRLRDQAPTQIAASVELPIPVYGGLHESPDPTGPPVPSPVIPPESGQVRQSATRFAQLQTTCGFACTEVSRTPVPGAGSSAESRSSPGPALTADARVSFSLRRSSSTGRRRP